jgi:hypothetical protein
LYDLPYSSVLECITWYAVQQKQNPVFGDESPKGF